MDSAPVLNGRTVLFIRQCSRARCRLDSATGAFVQGIASPAKTLVTR